MKQINAIRFIFENTDTTPYIKCEDIKHLYIGKINTVIQNVAVNCIGKMNIAHDIYIKLSSQANNKYNELGDKSYPIYIFDRLLQYNDITSIDLQYTDNMEETIYPIYDDENTFSNKYQTAYQENDCVIIKISDENYIK